MKPTFMLCLIGCSLGLSACQSAGALGENDLCTLRPITVTAQVRAYLRGPLEQGSELPNGYSVFLRDIAAHNAKLAAHCG